MTIPSINRKDLETTFNGFNRKERDLYLDYILNRYSSLTNYISGTNIQIGFGWGSSFEKTYGLTYEGIAWCVNALKIQATVTKRLEEIATFFLNMREDERKYIITDAGTIKGTDLEFHAIPLIAHRKKEKLKLFILDSQSNSFLYDNVGATLAKYIPNQWTTDIFTTSVARQSRDVTSCNAHAIETCRAFQENPDVTQNSLEQAAIQKKEGYYEISLLPSELMAIASPEKETQAVNALFSMLIAEEVNRINLDRFSASQHHQII